MSVTVALCTWNRAKSLRTALSSFTELVVPSGAEWEVLVVDNNSSDETPSVVKEYSSVLPIRYAFEPRQGLSHARNHAVQQARGDLLIFTDDDIVADHHWLANYLQVFEQHPNVAFFGGTIDLRFASRPPRWLINNLDRFQSAYAFRCVDSGTRQVRCQQDLPYGANMAFRRDIFSDIRFSPHLGRIASEMMSGEETELMMGLLKRGDTGIWIGQARVEHVVPKDRLTKKYIHDYFVCQGRGQVRLQRYDLTALSEKRMRKMLKRARRASRFTLLRDATWASAFKEAAMWEGRLQEIVAR